MNQQFESDVMHDLMADSPTVSADEAEDLYADDFENDSFAEDSMLDELNQYDDVNEDYGDEAYFEDQAYFDEQGFDDYVGDDFSDEFAEDAIDLLDAMEEAVADALDADDTDAFLRRLIGGIRGVAGAVRRGATVASRVAGGVQRVAGGVQRVAGQVGRAAGRAQRIAGQVGRVAQGVQTGGAAGLLQQLLPMLQQHVAQSSNEMDVFEELADWFEQEQLDEALPIVAGMAARAALRPVIRQTGTTAGRAVNRQIVRGTTQAARHLTRQQGARAVRALIPIATSVGRVAARRGMRASALPNAIRQATARVTAQPALARRLAQTTTNARPRTRLSINAGGSGMPRRFVLDGPVEIIIRR